ncbi:MAG: hypothetical protein KDN20_12605 [Verrucomicrobiae bacterium]|nr:hypothetical protein [Verrucomicrobiae bacterium]
MMRRRSLYALLLLTLIPTDSAWSDAPPAKGEGIRAYLDRQDFPARVKSVTVTADSIQIQGDSLTAPDGTELFLAEIRPHEDVTDPPEGRYLRAFAIKEEHGSFTHTTQRVLPIYDQIYSKWAVIARSATDDKAPDLLLSSAVYPTDLSAAAEWPDLKPAVSKTKKGVGGIHPDPKLFPDLAELGVGHITHNIILSSLLRQKAGPDTIPHKYAGRTYHFAKSGVAVIDRVTEFAKANNIIVSAIILVPNVKDRDSWAGRILTHPDADPEGIYSMANVATFEGVNHYAATMRFLAQRYAQPDAPYGRITHWIIHNEVDSGWVWTNAGAKSPHAYLDDYGKSMRIAYHAVRSYDPNAKVFISLTHHWTTSHKPKDPKFYQPRQLLSLLNRYGKVEGDFEWGLAYHPYPQSLFQPRTWEDKDARNDFDTPYITFKNIEVLDRWMRQAPFLYRGEKVRTIMLSEQGFHTDKKKRIESERNQAAALAYAWKKIAKIDSIEAFQYHRWIDHEREGGLNLGLWTVKPGTITLPAEKKLSWSIFQALDTKRESETIEFAKEIIGIADWSEITMKATL